MAETHPSELDWDRMQELYEQATERPPEERQQFLDAVCGNDAAIRRELESLLSHHSEERRNILEPAQIADSVHDAIRGRAVSPGESLIGATLGSFRVTTLLDSGGMGTVYVAEQQHPRQEVALKVMNAIPDSPLAARRFEYESEVLAWLQHPNIAKVYDAGMFRTERGILPWFALELISDAASILDYARRNELPTNDRLVLFAKVCRAAHFVHQRGVIHRDLKPANILVDAYGEPKIIDFGVARVANAHRTISTLTEPGHVIGTLQYMSPEQCLGKSSDLDATSDVYSLGVVLFQLICDELPYDLSSTPGPDVPRVILEQGPTRPGTIDRRLRGDLETIVLKALEKDRSRRYQTAAELASDIEHYLADEPITARPPSMTYLLWKYVNRHRWRVSTGVAAALAILAIVITLIVARYADRLAASGNRAERTSYGAQMNAAEAALHRYDSVTASVLLDRERESPSRWEWRYLSAAALTQECQHTLRSSMASREAHDIALAPEGRLLAVVYTDPSCVVVFDPIAGTELTVFENAPQQLPAVDFNHDGSLLAVSRYQPGNDHAPTSPVIDVWDATELNDRRIVARCVVRHGTAFPIRFHPTVNLLVGSGAGDLEDALSIWDLRMPALNSSTADPPVVEPLVLRRCHKRRVGDFGFSRDGSLLATADADDGAVKLWNFAKIMSRLDAPASLADEFRLATLQGHTGSATSVDFSPDSRILATAGGDAVIRLWDVQRCIGDASRLGANFVSGLEAHTLLGHTGGVRRAVFGLFGGRLHSAGGDRTLRVWRRDEDDEGNDRWVTHTIRSGHRESVRDLVVAPDGTVITSSKDGLVRVWDPEAEGATIELTGHSSSVFTVDFSPDGDYVASADGDGNVLVWSMDDASRCASSTPSDISKVRDLAWWMYESDLHLGWVHATNATGNPAVATRLDPSESHLVVDEAWSEDVEGEALLSITASRDGTRLAIGTSDGRIRTWQVSTQEGWTLLKEFQAHADSVTAMTFLDSRGTYLVSAGGCEDGAECIAEHVIRAWESQTGQMAWELAIHTDSVWSLDYWEDQGWLASASSDQTVVVHAIGDDGIPDPAPLFDLTGHIGPVRSVAFHPTEPRLASGSDDRTIKIWDLEYGIEVATLHGHTGSVFDLAWDPTGEILASSSLGYEGAGNVVRLWRTDAVMKGRVEGLPSESTR